MARSKHAARKGTTTTQHPPASSLDVLVWKGLFQKYGGAPSHSSSGQQGDAAAMDDASPFYFFCAADDDGDGTDRTNSARTASLVVDGSCCAPEDDSAHPPATTAAAVRGNNSDGLSDAVRAAPAAVIRRHHEGSAEQVVFVLGRKKKRPPQQAEAAEAAAAAETTGAAAAINNKKLKPQQQCPSMLATKKICLQLGIAFWDTKNIPDEEWDEFWLRCLLASNPASTKNSSKYVTTTPATMAGTQLQSSPSLPFRPIPPSTVIGMVRRRGRQATIRTPDESGFVAAAADIDPYRLATPDDERCLHWYRSIALRQSIWWLEHVPWKESVAKQLRNCLHRPAAAQNNPITNPELTQQSNTATSCGSSSSLTLVQSQNGLEELTMELEQQNQKPSGGADSSSAHNSAAAAAQAAQICDADGGGGVVVVVLLRGRSPILKVLSVAQACVRHNVPYLNVPKRSESQFFVGHPHLEYCAWIVDRNQGSSSPIGSNNGAQPASTSSNVDSGSTSLAMLRHILGQSADGKNDKTDDDDDDATGVAGKDNPINDNSPKNKRKLVVQQPPFNANKRTKRAHPVGDEQKTRSSSSHVDGAKDGMNDWIAPPTPPLPPPCADDSVPKSPRHGTCTAVSTAETSGTSMDVSTGRQQLSSLLDDNDNAALDDEIRSSTSVSMAATSDVSTKDKECWRMQEELALLEASMEWLKNRRGRVTAELEGTRREDVRLSERMSTLEDRAARLVAKHSRQQSLQDKLAASIAKSKARLERLGAVDLTVAEIEQLSADQRAEEDNLLAASQLDGGEWREKEAVEEEEQEARATNTEDKETSSAVEGNTGLTEPATATTTLPTLAEHRDSPSNGVVALQNGRGMSENVSVNLGVESFWNVGHGNLDYFDFVSGNFLVGLTSEHRIRSFLDITAREILYLDSLDSTGRHRRESMWNTFLDARMMIDPELASRTAATKCMVELPDIAQSPNVKPYTKKAALDPNLPLCP
jgi:hypothetical protein